MVVMYFLHILFHASCWASLTVHVSGTYTETNWMIMKELIDRYFGGANSNSKSIYSSLRLLEFGSQHFAKVMGSDNYPPFTSEGFLTEGSRAKYFFNHLGFQNHTSIDIHAWDSAVPLDCSEDITPHFAGSPLFDIVTDLRFSHYVGEGVPTDEVVMAQYHLWKSMHELSSAGSLHVHEVVELSTGLVDAGAVHHSLGFVLRLAELCGYIIEDALSYSETKTMETFMIPSVAKYVQREAHDVLTHTVFMRKKSSSKFISYEEFASITGLTVVDSRDSALMLLVLPDASVLAYSVTIKPKFNLRTWCAAMCEHYYSAVEAEVCEDFLELHVMVKLNPALVRLDEHDAFYKYGVVEAFLMELKPWPQIVGTGRQQ